MHRFTSTTPAHVDRIVFMDGTTLDNTVVMFFGDFIIVASNEDEEAAPSFYNVSTISKLIKVREEKPTMKISSW